RDDFMFWSPSHCLLQQLKRRELRVACLHGHRQRCGLALGIPTRQEKLARHRSRVIDHPETLDHAHRNYVGPGQSAVAFPSTSQKKRTVFSHHSRSQLHPGVWAFLRMKDDQCSHGRPPLIESVAVYWVQLQLITVDEFRDEEES